MTGVLGPLLAAGIAVSIGGNTAAAAMGAAYGARLWSRIEALAITALFVFLGAVLLGDPVVERLGGLILTDPPGAFLPAAAPAVTLSILSVANWLRVPVATTQVTVGVLAGVAIPQGALRTEELGGVVLWWLATPLVAGGVGYLGGRWILRNPEPPQWKPERPRRGRRWCLTAAGAFLAFTIGANNAGNPVAFLVASGLMEPGTASCFAGLFMALGVFVLGGPLLETVGSKITVLDERRAFLLAVLPAGLILLASALGFPVSLNQTVTAAVIGVGLASEGARVVSDNPTVRRIAVVWAVIPLASMGLALSLVPILV